MIELWNPIKDYESQYEVSNYGRIRSVERYARFVSKNGKECNRKVRSRILVQKINRGGYPQVTFSNHSIVKTVMVHRLVGYYFVSNKKPQTEINHIDGNKKNNHFSNLEWVTSSENHIHAYKLGLLKMGKEHHFSRMKRNSCGSCITKMQ